MSYLSRVGGWLKQDYRWVAGCLWLLGVLRAVILWLAYPPAVGPDGFIYYLFADQMWGGVYTPEALVSIYPTYPLLIWLGETFMGGIMGLTFVQAFLSTFVPVFFFLGIKPYNFLLALVAGGVTAIDPQIGVFFSLMSTDGLYALLLSACLCVFLRQVNSPGPAWHTLAFGVLCGVTVSMRPVGTFLIIPVAVVYAIMARSWRRGASVLLGTAGVFLALALLNFAARGYFGLSGSSSQYFFLVFHHPDLHDPANGPANARVDDILTNACDPVAMDLTRMPEHRNWIGYRCILDEIGDSGRASDLYMQAFLEVVQNRTGDYLAFVWHQLDYFMRHGGNAYTFTAASPRAVQCTEYRAGTMPLPDFDGMSLYYGGPADAQAKVNAAHNAMYESLCGPALPDYPALRERVVQWSNVYQLLVRPRVLIGAAVLALGLLFFSKTRRFAFPAFIAAGIFFYHALITAGVVGAQERYIAVTNYFREVLMLFVGVCAIYAALWVWRRVRERLPLLLR